MKRWPCLAASWLLLLLAPVARACPCSDDAGSGLALTREDELAAAALVMTTRSAYGVFDAQGNYRKSDSDETETAQELLLRAALRWPRRLEWLAELGYASYRLHAGQVSQEQRGVGDLIVRARYQLLDESMPHEPLPLPAVAASMLLRAPLGLASVGAAHGFGSGGAQLGLGAWELGIGLDAARSLSGALGVLVAGELGYRFEDHTLGRARQLGLRAEGLLGLRASPLDWLSGLVAVRARSSGDATFSGRRLPGTGERLVSVVVGASVDDTASGLRSSLTLSLDPPWSGLSAGSSAQVALGVAVGWSFDRSD
ncbi:MAG TPA: hypothetical protein VIW29_15640 [Polyangiaceae bacterium]